MRIEDDGTLTLHYTDLASPAWERTPQELQQLFAQQGLYAFDYNSRIAASYAFMAGCPVRFGHRACLVPVPQIGCQLTRAFQPPCEPPEPGNQTGDSPSDQA